VKLKYDNDFWRFSLTVYSQNEVAKECLALQDTLCIDVNILLFCAWVGTRAVALNREDIERASGAVTTWYEKVVCPLRAVRKITKTLSPDKKFAAAIEALEIKSEQIEQAILFDFSRQLQSLPANRKPYDAVAENVNEYIEMKAQASLSLNSKLSARRLIDAAKCLLS